MENPIRALNYLPSWRGFGSAWGVELFQPSLDRRLYVALHRAGWMGCLDRLVLETLVRPGDTVVDVGANIGLYSLHCARLAGAAGRVFSFEPSPELFDALERGIARNGAAPVRAFRLALGSRRDDLSFRQGRFNSGDNRLGAGTEAAGQKGYKVAVDRMDAVLAGEAVHLVKIDVQGWEAEVVRGMEGLLNGGAPAPALYFEYSAEDLGPRGGGELLELLSSHGYRFALPRRNEAKDGIEFAAFSPGDLIPGSYCNIVAWRDAPPWDRR